MRETVTCITPTGDRPLAFSLCKKWLANQTVPATQWIIVDDGKTSLQEQGVSFPSYAEYVRREPRSDDPKHTLGRNIKEAMPRIVGSKILIIEDDEYYAPTYIEEMCNRLNNHGIVGIGKSRYYNIPNASYMRDNNMWHASLAQTAFRRDIFDSCRYLFDDEIYIDVRIWETENYSRFRFDGKERVTDRGSGIIFDDGDDRPIYCGIKGLPGRPGMGIGHQHSAGFYPDPERQMLKKWIPDNYDAYLRLMGG